MKCKICNIEHKMREIELIGGSVFDNKTIKRFKCKLTNKEWVSWEVLDDLQNRFDVLFDLYAEHIHEHRFGVGEKCEDCIRIVNEQIDAKIKKIG